MGKVLLGVLFLLCLLSTPATCRAGTERIRVLAMGYLDMGPPIINTYHHDPLVTCQRVPSNFPIGTWDLNLVKAVGGRLVRQYFPRSRSALVEGYDFLVFEDCWLDPYSLKQEEDMKYAIESGLSAFMTVGRSCVTYTAWGWYGWHTSVLRELMPIKFTEDAASSIMHRNAGFTVKVVKDDPQVFSMFKQFGIEGIAGANNAWLEPRMGSTVWAEMVHPFRSPTGSKAWMVSWKVGDGGHFWNDADDLNFIWWNPYLNEYAPDIFMNILLHSTGRELPKDITIVHNVRRQYWLYSQYSAYLYSLFAFVEKFGASTLGLVDEMEQIDLQREQSFDEFRDQRYEESLATILSSMDSMEELEVKTFRLKDTTLMWVYLIQWASVTSVLLISGVLLWSLMVRRKLFHEVSVTKLIQEVND